MVWSEIHQMLLFSWLMWYNGEEGRTHIAGPKQHDVRHSGRYFASNGALILKTCYKDSKSQSWNQMFFPCDYDAIALICLVFDSCFW